MKLASAHLSPALARRGLLSTLPLLLSGVPLLASPRASVASDAALASSETQMITEGQFAYRLTLPQLWESKPNPVKTHQHEALFAAPGGARSIINSMRACNLLICVSSCCGLLNLRHCFVGVRSIFGIKSTLRCGRSSLLLRPPELVAEACKEDE